MVRAPEHSDPPADRATLVLADGFVLTGGASSRMGRNKAFLPWRDSTLLQHVADQVLRAAGTVRLVGQPDVYRHIGLETIPDAAAGCGPIAGVVAALRAADRPWVLIASCDLPKLRWRDLEGLLSAAGTDSASDAVIPLDPEDRLHPLCAVYRRRTLPVWEAALEQGVLRLQTVIRTLHIREIRQNEPNWLMNVNTPQEWRAALEGIA